MKRIENFSWPQNRRAAISLTFDDARPSQALRGFEILDNHDVKATFYVSVGALTAHLERWKSAVAAGHEIGNHTLSHPCSANFEFSQTNALEDYTPARMENELLQANAVIEQMLGVEPTTFAYPCGQKFVGRGTEVQSYVPLVARHFVVGRGFGDECPTSPGHCDLAQIAGMELDGLSFDKVRRLIDQAISKRAWLVLVGHEIADQGEQTVFAGVLDELSRYCRDPDSEIWIDRVDRIGTYVRHMREASG